MSWFENEEFWTVLAPIIIFGPQANAKAAGEASAIASHLRVGSAVLDLGCGLGRHALRLAELGFRVTAVDRCAHYLDLIRRTVEQRSLSLAVVEADMRVYCEPCTFDAVLNLGTTFGFFEDIEDDCRVVSNLYKSLRPDGLLIMDMVGKETMRREFVMRAEYQLGERVLAVDRKVLDDWNWIEEEWTLGGPRDTKTFHMCYRPYSRRQIEQLLARHAFRDVRISGDLSGLSEYPFERRLVAFARK